MKIHPMPVLAFLRFYVAMAFVGAASFWPVACSSMLLNTAPRSFAPMRTFKHILPPTSSDPVKPGAFFEDSATRNGPTHGIRPVVLKPRALPSLRGGAVWSGHALKAEREKPEAGSDRSAGDSASAVVQPLYTGRKHTEKRVPLGAGIKPGHHHELLYEVTAYAHGCIMPRFGPEGPARRAANGRWPIPDLTVAADTRLHPFGTELIVEGLGFRSVGDRGHVIKGRKLDLFLATCKAAREFGRRWLAVVVVPAESTRYADILSLSGGEE